MPVDITPEVEDFRTAVYGEEVRGSMISLAEKLADSANNSESVSTQAAADVAEGLQDATAATERANNAASSAESAASAASSAATTANSTSENVARAESARVNAESKRVTAENARASAESNRAQAESTRVSSEKSRASAETTRASAETVRRNNENARISSESERQQAESRRQASEATRVASETGRVNAEISRVSAESDRASTFSNMQRAFADMQEQSIPAATRNTLGGVIVGSGLNVDVDGVLSFEVGDVLTKAEAAETYATVTALSGKADAIHFHNASDITAGILPIARGGTGATSVESARSNLGVYSTTEVDNLIPTMTALTNAEIDEITGGTNA